MQSSVTVKTGYKKHPLLLNLETFKSSYKQIEVEKSWQNLFIISCKGRQVH